MVLQKSTEVPGQENWDSFFPKISVSPVLIFLTDTSSAYFINSIAYIRTLSSCLSLSNKIHKKSIWTDKFVTRAEIC